MLEHYQMPVYEYLTQTLLRHTGLNPAAADAIDLGKIAADAGFSTVAVIPDHKA